MKRYEFGQWIEEDKLTLQSLEELFLNSRSAFQDFSKIGMSDIYEVLLKLRDIWIDPQSTYRIQAQEILPKLTGFSHEMIRLGLDELSFMLDPDVLQEKVNTELRGIPVGQGFTLNEQTQTSLQYMPLGSILHILSGNVFLVGPGSLIEGLLTKNISILKMSGQENYFMPLFIQSIEQCDPDKKILRSIATLEFSSSQREIIEELKAQVDGIVVWGGEEAVKAYRNNLPARTRIVVFGPKLSVAIVTGQGASELGIDTCAKALAQDLSLWDQNACTAPQVCYVQGRELAYQVAESLSNELKMLQEKIPAGYCNPDQAVEIRKLRSIAEIAQGRSEGRLYDSGSNNLDYTVIVKNELEIDPSPLHRTLKIIPYDDFFELEAIFAPVRGYLQTVGLWSTEQEHLEISGRMGPLGAQRFFSLGQMNGGQVDDPHDGQYDLPQLLTLCVIRRQKGLSPWDSIDQKQRQNIINQKLKRVLQSARKSVFYQKRLKGKIVSNTNDLKSIDILERNEWETKMLPLACDLATRSNDGGYVTRSGGSTGIAKFSYFDKKDWEDMLKNAVRIFRASGLRASDRIANFMSAGDLYGSFISFNHVNYALGAQSFCFAISYDPESFVNVAKDFNINVIQGISTTVTTLLRQCKKIAPSFTIEKVMYAGQPMSKTDRTWIEQECGASRIISIIGTTEANQLGYQCPFLEGNYHHVPEDYNYVEIVDENGANLNNEEVGRMVVTGLEKHNYPLIRYNIGDAARWIKRDCSCGSSDPILEYRGRWDDIMSIGKMNLKYSDLRTVLDTLKVSELQIVGSFKGEEEILEVRIESTSDLNANIVLEQLQKSIPDIAMAIKNNYCKIQVRIFDPGKLTRNPRTGKVKALIDERIS